jgi:transposase
VLGYTIATGIGGITRFPDPDEAGRLHRVMPSVNHSGGHDRRGSLAENGRKTCAER